MLNEVTSPNPNDVDKIVPSMMSLLGPPEDNSKELFMVYSEFS